MVESAHPPTLPHYHSKSLVPRLTRAAWAVLKSGHCGARLGSELGMCKIFTISELQVCAMLVHLYSTTSLCKVLHGRLEVTKLFFKDLQDLTKCLLFGVLYSIIICGSIDSLQVFHLESIRYNVLFRLSTHMLGCKEKKYFPNSSRSSSSTSCRSHLQHCHLDQNSLLIGFSLGINQI